jgi:hypothetical protein
MAWEISWLEGTRDQLKMLAREQFPKLRISQEIGDMVVQKVEAEIRLHPSPSPDLPQMLGERLLCLGRIQVTYHTDSLAGRAEVRKATVL